ncbi:MAG: HAD-IIIA family hydrolase [Lachnospiraceae bacterium]|nr:HAD-IIIA family hydrolase [Lachnospiraceae bacterium]
MSAKPAVFLDRDGVLSVEKGYIISHQQLEIFQYSSKAVQLIHKAGYYAIVVTNQSAVARGTLEEKELLKMNEILIEKTKIDAVYYCPHYVNGVIRKYSFNCDCRKPKIGMIQKACEDFDIDMQKSFMVGDRASDIILGNNVGIYTVLLESGYGSKRLESEVMPDYKFLDLYQFAEFIILRDCK